MACKEYVEKKLGGVEFNLPQALSDGCMDGNAFSYGVMICMSLAALRGITRPDRSPTYAISTPPPHFYIPFKFPCYPTLTFSFILHLYSPFIFHMYISFSIHFQ